MRCAARRIGKFAREAGCVGRQICERDAPDAFGNDRASWSVALERIVKRYSLVRNQFRQDVGGKDLGQGTQPQQRILCRKLMGVRRSLSVSMKEDLLVANDNQNHAGRAGLKEELRAKSIYGLRVGKRHGRIHLRQRRRKTKQEQED